MPHYIQVKNESSQAWPMPGIQPEKTPSITLSLHECMNAMWHILIKHEQPQGHLGDMTSNYRPMVVSTDHNGPKYCFVTQFKHRRDGINSHQ